MRTPLEGRHQGRMATGHRPEGFRRAVLAGLARRPRAIPCKYLYDEVGSALFDRICELPEYHLTRAEAALLRRHGADIARLAGPNCVVVEPGAGAMTKSRLLLSALERPAAYVPVDIAAAPLLEQSRRLAAERPGLTVAPMVADFTRPIALPPVGPGRVLAFFPGSTIGNMGRREAVTFLRRLRRMAGHRGGVLVGVDPSQDGARLEAAYDDSAGVTAAFTLNLLARIRSELEGEIDADGFAHRARWDAGESRIEIDLVSRRAQQAVVAGRRFRFRAGEAIHIEHCHKYPPAAFHALAAEAGLAPAATWTSDGCAEAEGPFSLHFLVPAPIST